LRGLSAATKTGVQDQPIFQRKLQGCSSFKVIEVAIAYDSSLCSKFFGSSQDTAQAVVDVIAQASAFYEVFCYKVRLVHLEGYCESSTDPYRQLLESSTDVCGTGTAENLLYQFFLYWVSLRDISPRRACRES
jgi:hypothetical protein